MNDAKRNYNTIDLMKIIMALFVVALHRPLFGESLNSYNDFLNTVFYSIAVPFFMTVSSFLFFQNCSKYNAQKNYLIKHEKRLILLYCFWSIVYIPQTLISSIMDVKGEITFKIIIGEILAWVKNFFTYSTIIHLWYVNTLIVCIFILYLLRKKLKPEAILVICVVLSIITGGISAQMRSTPISDWYFNYVPFIFRNVLRKGLICCSFGMYIADRKKEISNSKSIIILSVVTAIEVILFFFPLASNTFAQGCMTYFFSSIKALSLFMLCKNIEMKDSPMFIKLRNYSSLIYFTHLLFSEVFLDEILHFKPLCYIPLTLGRFILTVVLSFALSFIICRLSKIKKLKFLKQIY